MNDLDPFDQLLRQTLHDVHTAVREPVELADRLVSNLVTRPVTQFPNRSRRQWLLPLLAAAVVILLTAGIVLGGRLEHHRQGPANTQTPVPTPTSTPTGAPSTPSPSRNSPSTTPDSSSRSAARPRATALTSALVENATIDIPAWGLPVTDAACVSGPRHFVGGPSVVPGASALSVVSSTTYTAGVEIVGPPVIHDFTGDGVPDAVVLLACDLHQSIGAQALLLVGNSTGQVVTQATVARAVEPNAVKGWPEQISAGGGSSVNIQWQVPDPTTTTGVSNQIRGYVYANGRFEQVQPSTASLPGDAAVIGFALTASHPGLQPACGQHYQHDTTFPVLRQSLSSGAQVALVEVTCADATGSSPDELGAYGVRRDGGLYRIGTLFAGTGQVGTVDLLLAGPTTWTGDTVTIRFGGLTPQDSLCCPSKRYQQIWHIAPDGISAGPITPVAS